MGKGRSSSSSAFSHNLDAEMAQILNEGSITVMIDLWKAFETVAPEALMNEAIAVGYPKRLMGMLILAYREPRVLKAFQSHSTMTVALQGNLAGCSHATTCLTVLLYRALRRASALHHRQVKPRALVDDCSLQWLAVEGAKVSELGEVVSCFFSDLKNLKMIVQPSKSGYVATTTVLAKAFAPLARRLGVIKKVAIRNLGHEMHGTKVMRRQEAKRMQALRARKHKLRILRQAAGGVWPSC